MPLAQRFDAEKAIEAILYVAGRVRSPTFHCISKILYFADKEKLSAFGSLISADGYVAMKHGPVPSETYDILKAVRGDGSHRAVGIARKAFRVSKGYVVEPARDPDMSVLSAADVQSLNAAIQKYGGLSFDELTNLSHDVAWNAADENDFINLRDIARATNNPEELAAYLADPFPQEN